MLICGSESAWSLGVLGSVSHGLYCELWRHQKRLARPFPDFAGTMGQESCEIQSIMEKETAKASAGWRVCQLKRKSVPVMRRKELSSALRNLKRENRGLGRRGKLNDARMDKLQEILLDINLGKCGRWMDWKYAIRQSYILCLQRIAHYRAGTLDEALRISAREATFPLKNMSFGHLWYITKFSVIRHRQPGFDINFLSIQTYQRSHSLCPGTLW